MLRGLTRRGWRLVVLTAAMLGVAGACSSEALTNGGPYSAVDGGSGFEGGGSDAFVGDVANNPDAVGMTTPTTALFVQASPSLPDVRLCWSTGGPVVDGGTVDDVLPFPGSGAIPGSNYPGIPLGGGTGLSDVGVLATGPFTLYAIDAENLARQEQGQAPSSCKDLICNAGPNPPTPCLRPNLDYWAVDSMPTNLESGTNVVAVTGCLASALDPLASTSRCGPSWTDVDGNLHAEVHPLLSVPAPDAGSLFAQAALLSPAIAAQLADGGDVIVSFGAQDGGGLTIGTLSAEGQTSPTLATLAVGGGLSAFGTLGFSVDVPLAGDSGTSHEWMSLAQAQQLVDPIEDPTVFFGQPRTYLVAVLGDPGAPPAFGSTGDGGYDGRGLHVLVLAAPAPPPTGGDAGDAGDL
jgi:hypothetical protein